MSSPRRFALPTLVSLLGLAGLVVLAASCEPKAPEPVASGKRVPPLRAIGAEVGRTSPLADAGTDAKPPPKGKVTVGIVVDQLAAWVAEERLRELPRTGGFARLAREGMYVERMEYAHAVTDTAPGHAALYTGRSPRETGIFGNEIFEGDKRVSILRDATSRVVTGKGPLERPGSSPKALTSPTVSEAWLAANPTGKLLSVSWKDRGAILPAGHVRDRATVVWFDMAEDAWVTSTAFADALPPFVVAEMRAHPASSFRASPWLPFDAAWVSAHAKVADDGPGEGDLEGLGKVFPHTATSAKAMRATPFADELVVSLANAGIEALTADGAPLLLELSLSGNDYVGHVFGPDSHEAWDELHRLDGLLAAFFRGLDARFGEAGWSVVLSADHGTMHAPEVLASRAKTCKAQGWDERPCAGTRLLPDDLGKKLAAIEPAVVGICDPWVFFRPEVRADATKRKAAEKKVTGALAKEPGVLAAYGATELSARCPEARATDVLGRVCASYVPSGGDVYVVTKPGGFFDPLVVVGKGVSHGSPYAYDRTVPLFVRVPGSSPRGRTVTSPLPFTAFREALESASGLGAAPSWSPR